MGVLSVWSERDAIMCMWELCSENKVKVPLKICFALISECLWKCNDINTISKSITVEANKGTFVTYICDFSIFDMKAAPSEKLKWL